MTNPEIPLQQDMFTGKLVDTRSRSQRQKTGLEQLAMFSLNQTFTFGQRVRPYLANAPRPTLELISEDVRTPEEVEQDLMREAQRQTILMPGLSLLDLPTQDEEKPNEASVEEGIVQVGVPMEESTTPTEPITTDTTLETIFTSPTVIPIEEPIDEDMEDKSDEEALPATAPPLSKYAAYLELVRVAEEHAAILTQSPAAALSETISMSLAQFDAKRAGLTESEIQMALAIGAFRGKPQGEQQAAVPKPETELIDEDIPILWLNRSDLIQRRPDLAAIIQKLGEHEIEFIAKKVGETIEEFYWIQLNVVLSLLIDYDCNIANQVAEIKSG